MTSLVYNINNHSIFVNMPRVIYPVLKCNYLERKLGKIYLFYCFCKSYIIITIIRKMVMHVLYQQTSLNGDRKVQESTDGRLLYLL